MQDLIQNMRGIVTRSGRVSEFLQAGLLTAGYIGLTDLLHSIGSSLNPALSGFVVLAVALAAKVIPVNAVERGAKFLIIQGPLFLIPPVVAIATQRQLLEAHVVSLIGIVVGGTVICAVMTAVAVEMTTRFIVRGQA